MVRPVRIQIGLVVALTFHFCQRMHDLDQSGLYRKSTLVSVVLNGACHCVMQVRKLTLHAKTCNPSMQLKQMYQAALHTACNAKAFHLHLAFHLHVAGMPCTHPVPRGMVVCGNSTSDCTERKAVSAKNSIHGQKESKRLRSHLKTNSMRTRTGGTQIWSKCCCAGVITCGAAHIVYEIHDEQIARRWKDFACRGALSTVEREGGGGGGGGGGGTCLHMLWQGSSCGVLGQQVADRAEACSLGDMRQDSSRSHPKLLQPNTNVRT